MTFREFRRLCLALPDAEERETWGEATFRVRGRIFAMGSADGGFVSVKASLDDQSGLVEMDPNTFAVSAYTGRFGWVRVQLAGIQSDMAQRLVANAWKRTAPKRLLAHYEESVGVERAERLSPPSPRARRGSRQGRG